MMSLALWEVQRSDSGFKQFLIYPRIQSFQHRCKGGAESSQEARKKRTHTSLQRQ